MTLFRILTLLLLLIITGTNANENNKQNLKVSYLKLTVAAPATLSSMVTPPQDSGQQGAVLAVNDANTTGKFVNQQIILTTDILQSAEQITQTLKERYASGHRIFLINADKDALRSLQQWASDKQVLLFNIAATADILRKSWCDKNTLHTALSDSMKTDALAQWLLAKRLTKVLVVHGRFAKDLTIVSAFERSAKRYGLKLIEKKQWDFNADLRRSAAREMPLFTQTAREYDVVFIADAIKDFADYLPYNTYLPRPVIGSAGAQALGWHARIEQWGALQLQNRFNALANRPMNETDFAGYVALRSISSAFLSTKSSQVDTLKEYIQSADFGLGAYLGRKLTYRQWNGQLRMPISILHPTALISQSPQQGILHPTNELDTLGFEKAESGCRFN